MGDFKEEINREDVIEKYKEIAQKQLKKCDTKQEATQQTALKLYDYFDVQKQGRKRNIRKHTQQFRTNGIIDPGKVEFGETVYSEDQYSVDKKYKHLGEKPDDSYLFFNFSPPKEIPGKEVREILRLYSDDDGTRKTVEETCIETEKTRDTVIGVLDAMDKIHASPQYTDEEFEQAMEKGDMDHLVKGSIESFKRQYKKKFESQKRKVINDFAEKWMRLQYDSEIINDLVSDSTFTVDVPDVEIEAEDDTDNTLIIPIGDVHIGSQSFWMQSEDVSEASARLLRTLKQVIDESFKRGKPKQCVLPFIGDFFQIDNVDANTSYGTDINSTGAWQDIVKQGYKTMVATIEIVRKLSDKTYVPIVEGNHDRMLSRMSMVALEDKYEDDEDIEIIFNKGVREYMTTDNSLLGFSHNMKTKIKDLPSIMSNEASEDWDQEQRLWIVGHGHNLEIYTCERTGTKVIQIPCMQKENEYEHRLGFAESCGLTAITVPPRTTDFGFDQVGLR